MKLIAAEKAAQEAESKLNLIVSTERQLRASKLELSSVSSAMATAEAELRRRNDPSFSATATVELIQVAQTNVDQSARGFDL